MGTQENRLALILAPIALTLLLWPLWGRVTVHGVTQALAVAAALVSVVGLLFTVGWLLNLVSDGIERLRGRPKLAVEADDEKSPPQTRRADDDEQGANAG